MKRSKNVSQALRAELPYWSQTGRQDWGNVGDPLDDAKQAGVQSSDGVDVARQKILKMLLRDNQIDTWAGSGIEGDWTDAEKRKLLLAWARAWAAAAARPCLDAIRERSQRDDD